MKAESLREQDMTKLKTTLRELVKKQFTLRMNQGSGQLAQNHQLRDVRRNIARVKTILHEKRVSEGASS